MVQFVMQRHAVRINIRMMLQLSQMVNESSKSQPDAIFTSSRHELSGTESSMCKKDFLYMWNLHARKPLFVLRQLTEEMFWYMWKSFFLFCGPSRVAPLKVSGAFQDRALSPDAA